MKFTRKPHKKLPADNLLAGKILYFSIVYLTGSSSGRNAEADRFLLQEQENH